MIMKPSLYFLLSLVFVVLLAVLGIKPTLASEDLMGLENGDAFYKSCKSALRDDLAENEFKETSCYYHITGWLQGAYYFAMHTTIQNKNDKCAHVYQQIEKDVNGRMCLPKGIKVKEIAISYVNYVEENAKSNQNKIPSLGNVLLNHFNCEE